MLKVNEYFEGKVKSIALENAEGKSTVGVMEIGDYEFGTSTVEHMFVVSGALIVMLPGETDWKTYAKGETFVVPANTKFKLQVKEQTAYCCLYV
ncbi:MAG: pyrimidine/purine nucleoside phosphorylase [Candidatus Cloacimonadaceae bacterium]|nr:pyrimidine/purine nucleoside phosphorylase [Candidatus Cloacimonadaceae bacterium]